ncbi:nitroreductase [Microbacterium sp. CH12i]|uniref:nitroreductase family deazaflavin-dependent oxidoreductase n=1 Tax=Microbacterium sp. CH12i TaxID=1479651 RepID=UPI00046138B9|nr:nitroreductase family deazaflavin-dependent oxidoreductase [Microbacterium sp. CH12i]KDA06470.1 nitroreductase [Microbacterium sp. CH12i]
MALTGEYQPSKSQWAREQAEKFEESQGSEANELRGMPIIVLTTVGAKTGALRKTALMRVEHEGRYAVIASLGGAPQEPKWAGNIRHHLHVELQDGAHKRDYLAREVEGEERDEWWAHAVAAFPDYDAYQAKTDRRIAVFVLEPMAEEDE